MHQVLYESDDIRVRYVDSFSVLNVPIPCRHKLLLCNRSVASAPSRDVKKNGADGIAMFSIPHVR